MVWVFGISFEQCTVCSRSGILVYIATSSSIGISFCDVIALIVAVLDAVHESMSHQLAFQNLKAINIDHSMHTNRDDCRIS